MSKPITAKRQKLRTTGQSAEKTLVTKALQKNFSDPTELLQILQKEKATASIAAQRLEQVIINLQTGVLLEDEARKIVVVNQTFVDLFNIPAPPEQLIGMDCSNSAEQSKHLFKNQEQFISRIDEILLKKEKVIGETLELLDGRIFERNYIPMFINREYKGHLWKYTDITSRIEHEKQLRKSEEKYRSIISNINLGLVEVDLDERIKYVNQSFCEISGYEEDQLIGMSPTQLFLDDSSYEELMRAKNESRLNRVSDVYEIPVKIKSGEKRWWLISGAPLFNDNGEVTGSIGIHLDITRQKNLEEDLTKAKLEAEKSSRAKELFLANMSHEIRTPLSGIYGMLQLLQGTPLNEEQITYTNAIDKAIDTLQSIITDILDFSKINNGVLHLETSPFSLKEELEAVRQLMSPKAAVNGVKIDFKFDDKLSEVYTGDAHRINQIITNLVGNSIKFTTIGSISINAFCKKKTRNKDLVLIEVVDTGIGIHETFLPRIFDAFTQEQDGKSKSFGGTGLGMSITKHLVSLMDGNIVVKSKKGVGTSVLVEFPLLKTIADQNQVAYHTEEFPLKGKEIIVAEDNDINATVIRSILSKAGAQVEMVQNGLDLINALTTKSFDLVISDIQMPVMSGIEAVKLIRERFGCKLRVIALTANALTEEKENCLKSGFNAVVFKPFKKDQLLEACLVHMSGPLEKEAENPITLKGSLYNLETLAEMLDFNQEQLRKLVIEFCVETPTRLIQLKKALTDGDSEEAKRIVHYLTSSIHHFYIESLFKIVGRWNKNTLHNINAKNRADLEFLIEQLYLVVAELQQEFQLELSTT